MLSSLYQIYVPLFRAGAKYLLFTNLSNLTENKLAEKISEANSVKMISQKADIGVGVNGGDVDVIIMYWNNIIFF